LVNWTTERGRRRRRRRFISMLNIREREIGARERERRKGQSGSEVGQEMRVSERQILLK
jgi:hypothetical protein